MGIEPMATNRAFRVTTGVGAEFGERVCLPNDLMIEVTLEDGTQQVVYLDTNYGPAFALLHEDDLDDAIPVDFGLDQIRVHVLSPVDLAMLALNLRDAVILAREVESERAP